MVPIDPTRSMCQKDLFFGTITHLKIIFWSNFGALKKYNPQKILNFPAVKFSASLRLNPNLFLRWVLIIHQLNHTITNERSVIIDDVENKVKGAGRFSLHQD